MMDNDVKDSAAADLEHAANEAVRDVKRGARRVKIAVAEGVEAIDDALTPSFGEQLKVLARSLVDDPASAPELARDVIRDHPIACVVSGAAVGLAIAKLIRVIRS
jgi:ElaB/YqjD/DUF883 family membrane-anchored ribosome-binding protein